MTHPVTALSSAIKWAPLQNLQQAQQQQRIQHRDPSFLNYAALNDPQEQGAKKRIITAKLSKPFKQRYQAFQKLSLKQKFIRALLLAGVLGPGSYAGWQVFSPKPPGSSITNPMLYPNRASGVTASPTPTYLGPNGVGQVPLPPIALDPNRNIFYDLEEVLAAANKGDLMPNAYLGSSPNGQYRALQFSLRTGKTVFLTVFTDDPKYNPQHIQAALLKAKYPVQISYQAPPNAITINPLNALTNLLNIGMLGMLMLILAKQMSFLNPKKVESVEPPSERLDDVGGQPQVVEQLRRMVEDLKLIKTKGGQWDPEGKKRIIPNGTLFIGPPGTGKTLLAKAVAGEAEIPFFSLSAASIGGIIKGRGVQEVQAIFKKARENAPSIVFFDELDAIGKQRNYDTISGEDDTNRTMIQLMTELNERDPEKPVIFMAATNASPDSLDPALIRNGRLDEKVFINKPVTIESRLDIIERKIRKNQYPLAENLDLRRIAGLTRGMTGSDLEYVVNEAEMLRRDQNRNKPAEQAVKEVQFSHFFEAILNQLLGRRVEHAQNEETLRRTQAHEFLGHGFVGRVIGRTKGYGPIMISAVPREDTNGNRSLGHVVFDPELGSPEQNTLQTRMEQLIYTLAGQAAERVVNGVAHVSDGAYSDLRQAGAIFDSAAKAGLFSDLFLGGELGADKSLNVFKNEVLIGARNTAETLIQMLQNEGKIEPILDNVKSLYESEQPEVSEVAAEQFFDNTLGQGFDWSRYTAVVNKFVEKVAAGKLAPTAGD